MGSVCVLMLALMPQVGPGAEFCSQDLCVRRVRDLLPAPPLGPSSPVQSVNQVEHPGGMVGTVWLEERLSVC